MSDDRGIAVEVAGAPSDPAVEAVAVEADDALIPAHVVWDVEEAVHPRAAGRHLDPAVLKIGLDPVRPLGDQAQLAVAAEQANQAGLQTASSYFAEAQADAAKAEHDRQEAADAERQRTEEADAKAQADARAEADAQAQAQEAEVKAHEAQAAQHDAPATHD